ncbi:hypothetical protein [Streptomonospora arabica]|uniref:Uncharacterized protein n=1 Tax=Streptomonospora arabica TaxID=412417 RepID=A0ABV9SSI2_9ACTN
MTSQPSIDTTAVHLTREQIDALITATSSGATLRLVNPNFAADRDHETTLASAKQALRAARPDTADA